MNMLRSKKFMLIVAIVFAVLAVAAFAWFAPFGTGEEATSPDKRYHASAFNYSYGTFFHGRVHSIGIEIVENSTGRVVWKAERFPLPRETPPLPELGSRSGRFIKWAPDSRSVAVQAGGGADTVFAVP